MSTPRANTSRQIGPPRTGRKSPGRSSTGRVALAAAIGIIALISGAAALVFTLVDATLLAPTPYRDIDQLVQIEARRGGAPANVSMRELEDLRERTAVFAEIAAYMPPSGGYTMSDGDGPPHEAAAVLVTHNLFRVLGTNLAEGNTFPESYDRERSFGIVLNDRIFRGRFGSDPTVFDRVLTLDGAPNYTVYGVLPAGFDFPKRSDLFRSIYITERNPNLDDRGARRVLGVARLKSDATNEQVRSELDRVARDLAAQFPDSNRGIELVAVPLREALLGDIGPYLTLIAAAALLLLVVGSVNASNLLLTRALGRQHQFAVRAALGAPRNRLAASVLAESCRIALLGVLAGLAAAILGLRLLRSLIRVELPSWVDLSMDGSVVLFALVAAAVLGLASGLLPTLRLAGVDPANALRGTRSSGTDRGRQRLVRSLLVAQVALAIVLLAGSASLLVSLQRLLDQDLGFENRSLMSMKVNLPWYLYSTREPERLHAFHERVLEELAAVPGVESVGLTTDLPLTEGAGSWETEVTLEGQAVDEARDNPLLRLTTVSTGAFDTLGIPLLEGREFDGRDRAESTPVAIVARNVAERLWPGRSPLGARLRSGDDPEAPWLEVIGVVGDVQRTAVDSDWQTGLALYRPEKQHATANVHFIARVAGALGANGGESLVPQFEQAVWNADPLQPVWDIQSMDLRLDTQLWREQTVAGLAGAFALAALLLAAAGVWAALAESVRQRRRELGLRVAVGARASDLLHLVLREASDIVVIGGALAALALFFVVPALAARSVLLEAPSGVLIAGAFAVTAALVISIAVQPARGAARIDPAEQLQGD